MRSLTRRSGKLCRCFVAVAQCPIGFSAYIDWDQGNHEVGRRLLRVTKRNRRCGRWNEYFLRLVVCIGERYIGSRINRKQKPVKMRGSRDGVQIFPLSRMR